MIEFRIWGCQGSVEQSICLDCGTIFPVIAYDPLLEVEEGTRSSIYCECGGLITYVAGPADVNSLARGEQKTSKECAAILKEVDAVVKRLHENKSSREFIKYGHYAEFFRNKALHEELERLHLPKVRGINPYRDSELCDKCCTNRAIWTTFGQEVSVSFNVFCDTCMAAVINLPGVKKLFKE